MTETIPLPKLIWPYKDEECQLLSLAEIKDLQREAMRVALEHAAQVVLNWYVNDVEKEIAREVLALRIEGEA